METTNYFLAKGNKINKNETLEQNNIKDNDVITLITSIQINDLYFQEQIKRCFKDNRQKCSNYKEIDFINIKKILFIY